MGDASENDTGTRRFRSATGIKRISGGYMTDNQSGKTMVKEIVSVLEEKKGEEITILDIRQVSVIADYFIIVSAENPRQLDSLSDAVQDKMEKLGFRLRRVEGVPESGWLLLDYNDVIVHVFHKEQRQYYDLERIWSDGKRILDVTKL